MSAFRPPGYGGADPSERRGASRGCLRRGVVTRRAAWEGKMVERRVRPPPARLRLTGILPFVQWGVGTVLARVSDGSRQIRPEQTRTDDFIVGWQALGDRGAVHAISRKSGRPRVRWRGQKMPWHARCCWPSKMRDERSSQRKESTYLASRYPRFVRKRELASKGPSTSHP